MNAIETFFLGMNPDHIMMYAILAFMMIFFVVYLYRLDKDSKNTINVMDLVTVKGRLNDRKFTRLITWIVSTWGFIYLISIGNLTEWYFIGYMGAWVANALIGKAIKDPNGEETPESPEEDTKHTGFRR